MVKCPHCNKQVTYQISDNWFKCPACGNWLCLRRDPGGSQWLEPGPLKDESGQLFPTARKLGSIQVQQSKGLDSTPSTYPANLDKITKDIVKQTEWHPSKLNRENYENVFRERETITSQSTTSSGGNGLAFGCGTILVGVAIYVFTRLIGFPLDVSGYVTLALVVLVFGVITIGIVQISK